MDRSRHRYYQSSVYPRPQPPKKRKTTGAFLKFAVVISIVAIAGWLLFLPTHFKAHSAALSSTSKSTKPRTINSAALTDQINKTISQSNLEVGVSITDLTNGNAYDYGLSDTPYEAASTAKLLSAALYLYDVENGSTSMSDLIGGSTAQSQLQKMIVDSDNDAWVSFNDYLGHEALLSYAGSIGINDYDPQDNTIVANDLALLLTKLYQGKLLNSQHTKLLLSYMSSANETEYIEASVPAGYKFYHKAGFLDDRAMDAAIIDNGVHPYVLVIFTKDPSGQYDQTAGQQLFASITSTTLNAFAK